MGCKTCKEKTPVPITKKPSNTIDIVATWGIIIWSLLGIYGLYSLIKDLL